MGVTQSCARACECSTDKKFSKTLAEAHLSAEEIDALTEEIEAWCDSHRLLLSPRDFLSRLKGKDLGYEELQDFAKRAPPEAVTGIYADCLRSRLASLVSLELSCFPLSDRDIATPLGNFLEFTAKELGDLSRIQVVDLSYTNISSRALRAVAVPLGRLPTFSVLNLSNNGGEATVDGRLSFSGEGFINFLADLLSTTR
uniref:Uncharacterized protein n=1 Tax=Chromera velia CCMP2878 TaxID=1169474 RepID=A0A0G4HE67_9ALVE|eukprot:Cvel_6465.t1-p1 / transcript=Cvel_6465.t1 / gene=Cvel_6465 / organism=Chromera_velia_CCMP2878 / gene_product=hypothetical protein / transcript_product=hypothetical protein / location=Cvel_scaffold316:100807-101400(+) / protein_length=198 / sequence_SO=supercontig / SO=protein_coding / is_pseudo=false